MNKFTHKYFIPEIVSFIKKIYNQEKVLLHEPVFLGNEKKYLQKCIDSTFVSYVGEYVTEFEDMIAKYTDSNYAVAVVNGTVALKLALEVCGVKPGDEVITQPLTFVATVNAISHCKASPVFIDIDTDTLGMSPEKLELFLKDETTCKYGKVINKKTKNKISAIVPVHTFGFPCRIDDIVQIGNRYNIPIIEDSAESLGSFYKEKHTGNFGRAGIISFNGNKIITTGGGGMIITNDEQIATKAKHLSTTAKVPHGWEYVHDEIGYNYRMPNINAAVGVAQMENINKILKNKKETAELYKQFISTFEDIKYFDKLSYTNPNYWLNTILFNDISIRNEFLEITNNQGIQTRPAWRLLNKLIMYRNCISGNLDNALIISDKIVNLPSGYRK